MEPPNNGQVRTRHFVLYKEVVLSSEVKYVLVHNRKVELKCVLYREVFSIVSFIGGSTELHLARGGGGGGGGNEAVFVFNKSTACSQ